MVSLSSSFKNFLLLYLGACVMLAGVLGFFAMNDQDWKYSLEETRGQAPRHQGTVHYYSELPPEKQRIVDSAAAGEIHYFETEEPVPPSVVEYKGTYLVFKRFTVFDWLNPETSGPIVASLVGLGMMVYAGRRDVGA